MARPTLKLPARTRPAQPAKPLTTRALQARRSGVPAAAARNATKPVIAAPAEPRAATPTRPPPRTAKPAALAAAPTTRAARPTSRTATPTARAAPPKPARPPFAKPVHAGSTKPSLPSRKEGTDDSPRLSKRMSELGLCSRREADEWIENGWVRVDGKMANTLGTRVSPTAKIEIDAEARKHQSQTVTFLLHKPIGYVSGQAEDGYPTASVLLRPENRWAEDRLPLQWKPSHLRGLAPAGRLDIDSTGLIVFTQDGRVARRLIGHDTEVEKEYLVRVEGTLPPDGLERLRHGLSLDGELLKPAAVSWQNEHQLRFVLRQGKKRQIRRMCELVGLQVTGLKRVRTGSVVLGKLPVGMWRYLRPDEKF